MSDRRGFTLIELMVVVLIVSILAAIAQPKLSDVLVKARAADAYADMEVVRVAALAFQADQNVWPPNASRGVVPTGLDEFLPADFSMTKSDFQLDFDNWGGSPFDIGITIITSDAVLGLTLLDMLPPPKWNSGDKYSWVIE
jgi:prepilin-type N-terminal cleavage/methylation domain-containing protein